MKSYPLLVLVAALMITASLTILSPPYSERYTLTADVGSDSWGEIFLSSDSEGVFFRETLIIKNATLPTGRSQFDCAENSATHKIYCFGGWRSPSSYYSQILEYNPSFDNLTIRTATLPQSSRGLSCAENSATHKIYCFGGEISVDHFIDDIVEYNPVTDTRIRRFATIPARYGLSCTENSATHMIYCFGGWDGSNKNDIYEYNPANDTIIRKASVLPDASHWKSCAENSATHLIYCFGGEIGGPTPVFLNEILEYNPANDSIVRKNAVLPSERFGLSCAENPFTHKIYCFGGSTYTAPSDQIVEYDSALDLISVRIPVLPSGRFVLSCSENSGNNKIYCFGGTSQAGDIDQILEYTHFVITPSPQLSVALNVTR